MSDGKAEDEVVERSPERAVSPELRRAVSRRSLITDELGRAGASMARQLPQFASVFGMALREPPARRRQRMLLNLWQLLMGREPKPEEREAGMEVLRAAKTVDESADGLVDVAWALCQTKDFEALNRPNPLLVRGLYRIALDRDPTEEERTAALEVLAEAQEHPARVAALEGLFTGLLRSAESVLRKS